MRPSTSLALAAFGLCASALPAAAGTLLVPSQFPTVQKALNAAKPYDTVLVSAKPNGGVYNEAVTVSTPHLVLQGRGNPVLDGAGLGTTADYGYGPVTTYPNAVDVRASHVAVRGLTVRNVGAPAANASAFVTSAGVNVGYSTYDSATFSRTYTSFNDIEVSGCTFQKDSIGILISAGSGVGGFGTAGTNLKGYSVFGNVVTASATSGIVVSADSALVAGNTVTGCSTAGQGGAGISVSGTNIAVTANRIIGNGAEGLDLNGDGLLVTANEVGSNANIGIYAFNSNYDPTVNDPQSPNPPASTVAFNSVHDNKNCGIDLEGTMTVSGNAILHNTGYGLFLNGADYSTVSFNQIGGTTFAAPNAFGGAVSNNGTGLYASYIYDGPVTITANQSTGNAADGILLDFVTGSTASYNSATGNAGVGIHLSSYAASDTVTQNRAFGNKLGDARDDTSALNNITYADGEVSYGYAGAYGASTNVWTKNLFGMTDPAGLGK